MVEISDAELQRVQESAEGDLYYEPVIDRLVATIRALKAQLESERQTVERIKTDAKAAKKGRYPLGDFVDRVLILLQPAPTNDGASDGD